MSKQLFDDLTADAPPSTVDVPGIIRREKRRRTSLRAGGSAAVVLAVASAFMVLGPGSGTPPGSFAVSGTSSAGSTAPVSAPASAPGFRLVADDQASAAVTAETLRAALDAAVRRAAPGATWLAQGSTATVTPDGSPPRLVGDDLTHPTEQMFTGTTGIALAGRRGSLSIDIVSPDPCTGGSLAKCPEDGGKDPKALDQKALEGLFACQPAAQTCTANTGAGGRRQRVQRSVSSGGFVSEETNIELADGRALLLAVDNEFIAPGSNDTNHVAQPATPLSAAQVKAIATTIAARILP